MTELKRKTKETDISLKFELYGKGKSEINTGIGFLDHMLTLFAAHGCFDLQIKATGDLQVDAHHTVEDIGITLGQAFYNELGNKKGITRYGSFYLPMDEALALVCADISGRPYVVNNCAFPAEKIGELDSELIGEFLYAFAFNAKITLHINLIYGDNGHHIAEAVFKGMARALKTAAAKTGSDEVPSTKGILE